MNIYYKFDQIIDDVFTVQEETSLGRRYITFPSVTAYTHMLNTLNHCHEVFKDPFVGRPAFDFDFPSPPDKGWEQKVETTLRSIFNDEFGVPNIKFVWMETKYETSKVSKHLVIQNVRVTNWNEVMKRSIALSLKMSSGIDVDTGIYRKNGSLRLPLNAKLDKGVAKTFIGNHSFFSGLVGIYPENEHEIEYTISKTYAPIQPIISSHIDIDEDVVNERLKVLDGVFEVGGINGEFIHLKRIKGGECLITGVYHERDNAYLIYKDDGRVLFGCYRGCKLFGKKTISL